MTVRELIEEKSKRLKEIPDKLLSSIEKSQKKIYDELIGLISKLKRDSTGNIIPGKENFKIAAKIVEDLKQVVYSSDYVAAVTDFAAEFDKLKPLNDKYFSSAFHDFTNVTLADDILQNSKTQIVKSLIAGAIEPAFISPVDKLLNDAIASGAGFVETVKQLRAYVEGGKTNAGQEIDGKLLHYAKQLAHDSFAISDAKYTNTISDSLGAEWYFYDGTEVAASRCFCLERKGKYFHYKEIESWGRGENIGGGCGFPWAGMNIDTNETTIYLYRGGYNCLDSLMIVSIAIVPKQDIERAMSLGLFEPSEFEAKELGLMLGVMIVLSSEKSSD